MTQTPTTLEPFGRRLDAAMRERSALCVGIDPHASELAGWGLPDTAGGARTFSLRMVEAAAGIAAIVKPQSAFFERHGSAGIAVLEEVLAAAREAGLLVLLDVKRGDIGTTAAAYADAYLRPSSPLFADAITVNPYLGPSSLEPFIDAARASGSGLFVLAYTSNPDAGVVQQAVGPDGGSVTAAVLRGVAALNAGSPDRLGSFGVVVGATRDGVREDLAIGGPILSPGLGAQGATAADLPALFGDVLPAVLPSASRSLSGAGPDPVALRRAVVDQADQLHALV